MQKNATKSDGKSDETATKTIKKASSETNSDEEENKAKEALEGLRGLLKNQNERLDEELSKFLKIVCNLTGNEQYKLNQIQRYLSSVLPKTAHMLLAVANKKTKNDILLSRTVYHTVQMAMTPQGIVLNDYNDFTKVQGENFALRRGCKLLAMGEVKGVMGVQGGVEMDLLHERYLCDKGDDTFKIKHVFTVYDT